MKTLPDCPICGTQFQIVRIPGLVSIDCPVCNIGTSCYSKLRDARHELNNVLIDLEVSTVANGEY